jgi:hypothetical protein
VDGRPLAGEVVSIYLANLDGVQTQMANVLSDDKGRFCFVDVIPGEHMIQAGGSGAWSPATPRVRQAGRQDVARPTSRRRLAAN